MDSTMVIPPARRVCDSVLVAVEDLSRRRFKLSDEEVLFAGFCAFVQSRQPAQPASVRYFSILANSWASVTFYIPNSDSSKFHGQLILKSLRRGCSLAITGDHDLGITMNWVFQSIYLQSPIMEPS